MNVIDQSSQDRSSMKLDGSGVGDQSHREEETLPSAGEGRTTYRVNKRSMQSHWGALVDRGANGGIAGRDTRLIQKSVRTVDLTGIRNHTVKNLEIVTAGAVVKTQRGEVILILNQYAYMPECKTIHSCPQIEHFKGVVNDKAPVNNNGTTPYIKTLEGFMIPLQIRNGLPYMEMRPYTDDEFNELPHVHLTADGEWNPRVVDAKVEKEWYKEQPDHSEYFRTSDYDMHGQKVPSDDENDGVRDKDKDPMVYGRRTVTMAAIRNHFKSLIEDEIDEDFMYFIADGEVEEYRENGRRAAHATTRRMREETGQTLPDSPLTKRRKERKAQEKTTTVRVEPQPRVQKKANRSKAPRKRRTVTVTFESDDDEDSILDNIAQGAEDLDGLPDLDPKELTNWDTSSSSESEDDDAALRRKIGFSNKAKEGWNRARKAREPPNPIETSASKKGFDQYMRYFPGSNEKTIKKTFEATTQYGRKGSVGGLTLQRTIKAPNPALNVPRRNEPVATDTIYGPCKAIDNGSTAAQYFHGRYSNFRSVRPCGTSDKQFATMLLDEIRKYGAMDVLISDDAKAQLSEKAKDVLRTFGIRDWQSEPYNKNQNYAERGWRDAKRHTDNLMNMSNAPDELWLLALEYVCFVMNHTAMESLGWRTPVEWLLGYTPDITVLLQFMFYEPVYYLKFEGDSNDDAEEEMGRFVGIAEQVGHAMTYKVLTNSGKTIKRAILRTAAEKDSVHDNARALKAAPNLAHKIPTSEPSPPPPPKDDSVYPSATETGDARKDRRVLERVPVRVTTEDEDSDSEDDEDSSGDDDLPPLLRRRRPTKKEMPRQKDGTGKGRRLWASMSDRGQEPPEIDVQSLRGRTFITRPDPNGEQERATIEDVKPTRFRTPDGTMTVYQFRCRVGEKRFNQLVTYNRMLEWCEEDACTDEVTHKFRAIHDHKKIKGEWYCYLEWEDDAFSWNSLTATFNGDPTSTSLYAKKNNLLYTDGWKRCRSYVKDGKKAARMANQAKLKAFRTAPRYKFGYQRPYSHTEAMWIDEKTGNRKWHDSEALEVGQLLGYDSFRDMGKGTPVPEGYTLIPCHFVYDIKHDGRHKSRFVAGGHRTSTPIESVYSSVVSLLGVRIVTFLAEHNGLELWSTDIGNAYLESYTQEKVCFYAGPEFGDLEGHLLIIDKAQYGLKSSGKRWHEKLHDILRDLGFYPSLAEEDIWMRDAGDHYEYIAVYVDDLLIASKDPKAITDALEGEDHKLTLKGTGPTKYHLGCDFVRDEEGILCVGPRRYIDKMKQDYEAMFGEPVKSRGVTSPLVRNDHPELDESEPLDVEDIRKYQSLIGTLQWAISLGRFDIATAVMSMSSFRVAPRRGHLERLKRVCGYLAKMQHGMIRVRTDMPDFSALPITKEDWSRSVYGDVKEEIPKNAPPPKGKPVVTVTYKDANLYHDMITGKAVSGVLHFLNQTCIDWTSKKQATVEAATYGSEFVSARTATQQIIGLRLTLRYLGVPIQGQSIMFGDNESVVKSASLPHSRLHKRHHGLSYHLTREAIASDAVYFHHIPGHLNPSDILSKHWGYQQVWPMMQPILFWQGDTGDLLDREESNTSENGERQVIRPKTESASSNSEAGKSK